MDRLNWFKFDPTKWLTGRIQRCSLEARDSYLRLCCIYWSNECKMTAKRARLECGQKAWDELIESEIISVESDFLVISFLNELMDEASEKSRKAKRSAEKRWTKEDSESNANDMRTHSERIPNAMQSDSERNAEERREEERREEKITTTSLNTTAADVINSQNWYHNLSLIADSSWASVVAMNNRITLARVHDYCVSFYFHLIQEGKVHDKFHEYRKHANNWIRYQIANGIQAQHKYDKETMK